MLDRVIALYLKISEFEKLFKELDKKDSLKWMHGIGEISQSLEGFFKEFDSLDLKPNDLFLIWLFAQEI